MENSWRTYDRTAAIRKEIAAAMLAARFSDPGNGDDHWLGDLIAKINEVTIKLQGRILRIGSLAYPEEEDVKQAYDLVTQLLGLISEQILPRRLKLSQTTSGPGSASSLNKALNELSRSSQNALIAMAVYSQTLDNENRQRVSERRSNKRYAADQQSLQNLRFDAAREVANLLSASEGFMHYISQ
jgi:hypothetical protein